MATYASARVSTAFQVAHGDSLEDQESRIRAWCAFARVPAPVVIERDEGISGAELDGREGCLRAIRGAIECAERGEETVFIVADVSRLGRSAVDVLEAVETLLAAGVRIVTLDGADSGSAFGALGFKMLVQMRAMMAEVERDTINTRLQSGRTRARERGEKYSREPAYGTRTDKAGKLVVDEGEQRVIARARALKAEGLSYEKIASKLESENLRPRHAKHWSVSTLHSLVTGKRATPKKKNPARVERFRERLMKK